MAFILDHERKTLPPNDVNAARVNPEVWNELERAQELGKEKKSLAPVLGTIGHLQPSLADSTELYEVSKDGGDLGAPASIRADAEKLRAPVE